LFPLADYRSPITYRIGVHLRLSAANPVLWFDQGSRASNAGVIVAYQRQLHQTAVIRTAASRYNRSMRPGLDHSTVVRRPVP
jgi:hypothetical protein